MERPTDPIDQGIYDTLIGNRNYDQILQDVTLASRKEGLSPEDAEKRAQKIVASLKREEEHLEADLKHPQTHEVMEKIAFGMMTNKFKKSE